MFLAHVGAGQETETVEDHTEMPARRGLGPFTGAQLTVIIVVFAVLLLAPIGAWAVSTSSVSVTDAGSGQHATVSASGQLKLTRAGAKGAFTGAAMISDENSHVLITSPARKALVVTSVFVDIYRASATGAGADVVVFVSHGDATCAAPVMTNGVTAIDENPAGVGMTVYPFDPGLIVRAGRALCARNLDPADLSGEVMANGYMIPAAAAPSGGDERAAATHFSQH
jgi:hypothetical protein